jgi:AcrR family transcriptional regulator
MAEAGAEHPGAAAPARAPDGDREAARRARIVDATFSLLLERGYAGTSTDDIAGRARVSKRELYRLFESKQAILTACITRHADQMRRPLAVPRPRDRATLAAALAAFGSGVLREHGSPAVLAVYRLAASEAERSPEVARALDSAGRGATRAALTELLAGAQAVGLLGAGEPAAMAGEFLGLLWGDLLLRLVLRLTEPPPPEEADRRARAAAGALLRLHPAP